jgi:hypothetical protein
MPEANEAPSLAERFWSHAPGPESEDLPEPERSAKVVDNFLTALSHLENLENGGRAAPVLIALLRRAEVEGDPSYSSPEQVRGENLDVRSAIFSLGVVLFERLTGRHPFGAENNRPRRVARIRRGEMGSGVNSFPTIPSGLRAVLVRAMSPFAEERYTDLRELRIALRHTQAESAPRHLPGASAAAGSAVDELGETTKVVSRPTLFGRDLMKVVDEHDKDAGGTSGSGGSGAARAKPRSSAPPAGVASGAVPAGRTNTPASGRPSDVMTSAKPVPPAEAAVPSVAASKSPVARGAASGAKEKEPVLHAQPWPRFDSTPTPVPAVAPATADDRAKTEPDPSTRPRTVADPPLRKRTPVAVIAIGGALAGAVLTLAVVKMTRRGSSAGSSSETNEVAMAPTPTETPTPTPTDTPTPMRAPIAAVDPAPAPAPTTRVDPPAPQTSTATTPVAPPVTPPVTSTATVPVTTPSTSTDGKPPAPPPAVTNPNPTPPAPAPAPTPAPAPAPAATGSLVDLVTGAVTPCVAASTKTRIFGLSLAMGKSGVAKAYFGSDDPLTPEERRCIGAAVKGLAGSDAPRTGNVELRARAAPEGVTITLRQPRKPI